MWKYILIMALLVGAGGIGVLKMLQRKVDQRSANRRLAVLKLVFEAGQATSSELHTAAEGHLSKSQIVHELELAYRHNEVKRPSADDADGPYEMTPTGERVYTSNSLEVFDLATDI